jgi:hypothetical protein
MNHAEHAERASPRTTGTADYTMTADYIAHMASAAAK